MPAWRYAWRTGAGHPRSAGARVGWRGRLGAPFAWHRYPPALIAVVVLAVLAAGVIGLALGRATTSVAAPGRNLIIENPYALQGTWYKGNLHVASVRGVGHDLPSTVGQWYASHGYGLLGISDVNTYTWMSEYGSRQLTAVPVVQASYPFGDLLGVGDDHWLPASNLQQAIDGIASDGALPVLAAAQSRNKGMSDEVVIKLKHLFGLEIYDASFSSQGDALSLWDRMLSSGQRVYAFAGDGVSGVSDPATGHAWIAVDAPAQDLDTLLSSLRAGAFIASTGPSFKSIVVKGSMIDVQATGDVSLRFIGKDGHVLEAVAGAAGSYRVRGSEKYVRIEAVAPDGSRAWSQPLFISWR